MKKITVLMAFICLFSSQSFADMESGIRLMNAKKEEQAYEVFKQEADKGNAHARFWQGLMQIQLLGFGQFQAGSVFLQAAEAGDPWAMHILVPKEYGYCNQFHWPECNSDWEDKAIAAWKKQAAQGDGKAMWALTKNDLGFIAYIPYFNKKRYTEIKWQALLHGCNRAAIDIPNADSKAEQLKPLFIAAKRGYAPAMVGLFYHLDNKDEATKWAIKAVKLGYGEAAFALAYSAEENNKMEDAYFWGKISVLLGCSNYEIFIESPWLSPVFKTLSSEKKHELDIKINDFLKGIEMNLFLDETSVEFYR